MKTKLSFLSVCLFGLLQINSQIYTTGTISLSATTGLAMSAKIDVGTEVTLTLTGPSDRWIALGFNASNMANGTDVVRVHTSGTLISFDNKLTGQSAPVIDPTQNWTISNDQVVSGIRTIVATRALNTGDANDYTFSATPTTLSLIWARASTASYSGAHAVSNGNVNRGFVTGIFTLVPPPTTLPPTGSANQSFCDNQLLSSLSASGTNILWYATATSSTPLPLTTSLVNGTTYYASQTINGIESVGRLAVTVSINFPVSTSFDVEITSPETYTWNGQVYSQGGSFTQSFSTVNGCDSTVTLNLLVFTVGVEELNSKYFLVPNPASCDQIIKINGLIGNFNYQLIDSKGIIVKSDKASDKLSLEGLNPGIYFFCIDEKHLRLVIQ